MITSFHDVVTGFLQRSGVPTLPYIPDEAPEDGVVIVGPITGRQTTEPAVMALELELLVLGRRIFDAHAQDEMNKMADNVIDLFGGSRGIRHDGIPLAVDSFTRRTLLMAGMDVPTYAITVQTSAVSGC